MARGFPTKFKPEYVEQAGKLAELGHTDAEMADFFGVGVRNFHMWKSRHPALAAALRVGKDVADERVKRALFQNAVGYTSPDGQHYPPNTTACIFWLKNRRPDEWREKFEHDHGLAASREKLQELLRAVEERLGNLEASPDGVDRGPRRTQ